MTDSIGASVPTINNLRDSLFFLSSQTSEAPTAELRPDVSPTRGASHSILAYSNTVIQ